MGGGDRRRARRWRCGWPAVRGARVRGRWVGCPPGVVGGGAARPPGRQAQGWGAAGLARRGPVRSTPLLAFSKPGGGGGGGGLPAAARALSPLPPPARAIIAPPHPPSTLLLASPPPPPPQHHRGAAGLACSRWPRDCCRTAVAHHHAYTPILLQYLRPARIPLRPMRIGKRFCGRSFFERSSDLVCDVCVCVNVCIPAWQGSDDVLACGFRV